MKKQVHFVLVFYFYCSYVFLSEIDKRLLLMLYEEY